MSYYVHDVPGRLRVKNPFMKGNETLARELEELLKTLGGVRSVSTNPLTGSIVVNYDPESLDSKAILATLQQNGHFHPALVMDTDQYVQEKVSQTGRFVGKALLGLFIEKAFEGTPLALLSVML